MSSKTDEPKFQTMKVFDCQDMPANLRAMFFEFYRDRGIGNDCYVTYYIHSEVFKPEDENSQHVKTKKALDSWLIENGAEGAKSEDEEGEEVIISHWW